MASRPPKVSRRAAVLAGWDGDEDTARNLLGNEDEQIRASALGALHRMECITPDDLIGGLDDVAPHVRRRALQVLALRWSPELSALIPSGRLLDDDDPVVLETACFVAGECAPAPPETIARLMEIATDHEEVLCRESAVAALGSLGDPIAAGTVIAACSDKATVRRRAVLALVAFEGPEIDATLQLMAEDRDWQVRQAAEELLAID